MGPEFAAAAPYIFGAGTALSMYGQDQQGKEQQNIINRSLAETEDTQKKGVDKAVATAADLTGESRAKQMQMAEDSNFNRTQADLQGAGADLIDTSQPQGGSQQFLTAKADRAAQEGDRLTSLARELAKVRSTGEVQTNQGIKLGRLAEELGSAWNSQHARGQAAQMDAGDVGIGGLGQLGQIAQIVGGAGMMGGGAAAGAGAGSGLSEAELAAAADGGLAGTGANAGQTVTASNATSSQNIFGAPSNASIWGSPATQQMRRRQQAGYAR